MPQVTAIDGGLCPVCDKTHAPSTRVSGFMNKACYNRHMAQATSESADPLSRELSSLFALYWDRDYHWKGQPYLSVKFDNRALLDALGEVFVYLEDVKAHRARLSTRKIQQLIIEALGSK